MSPEDALRGAIEPASFLDAVGVLADAGWSSARIVDALDLTHGGAIPRKSAMRQAQRYRAAAGRSAKGGRQARGGSTRGPSRSVQQKAKDLAAGAKMRPPPGGTGGSGSAGSLGGSGGVSAGFSGEASYDDDAAGHRDGECEIPWDELDDVADLLDDGNWEQAAEEFGSALMDAYGAPMLNMSEYDRLDLQ